MGRIRTCDLRVMSPASWPLLYHAKSWSLTIAFRSPLQEVRRFFWLRIRYRGRSTLPVFLTSIIARQHSPGVILMLLWTMPCHAVLTNITFVDVGGVEPPFANSVLSNFVSTYPTRPLFASPRSVHCCTCCLVNDLYF